MLGEHPAMVGRGVGTRLRRDPSFDPLAKVAHLLRRSDLPIANLEGAISDWPRFCRPSRRECRAPSVAVRSLVQAGFKALMIANNHIQQHGPGAVQGTLDLLNDNGIAIVGLAGEKPGTCRPVEMEIKGLPVRLLGYSLRPRQHFSGAPVYAEGTTDGIMADVADGKAAGAVVVVCIHWGDEFVPTPSRQQVSLGRAMIDAGCTLVLGHHPHVLQGWERYRNGAIFYSLGNLVFDMPWLPELRRSVLCELSLSPAGCGEVVLHPLVLDREHCPRPAEPAEYETIMDFLRNARDRLEQEVKASALRPEADYPALVTAALKRERLARNRYFLKSLWRYRPDVAAQLIGKFLLRRVGLLND